MRIGAIHLKAVSNSTNAWGQAASYRGSDCTYTSDFTAGDADLSKMITLVNVVSNSTCAVAHGAKVFTCPIEQFLAPRRSCDMGQCNHFHCCDTFTNVAGEIPDPQLGVNSMCIGSNSATMDERCDTELEAAGVTGGGRNAFDNFCGLLVGSTYAAGGGWKVDETNCASASDKQNGRCGAASTCEQSGMTTITTRPECEKAHLEIFSYRQTDDEIGHDPNSATEPSSPPQWDHMPNGCSMMIDPANDAGASRSGDRAPTIAMLRGLHFQDKVSANQGPTNYRSAWPSTYGYNSGNALLLCRRQPYPST